MKNKQLGDSSTKNSSTFGTLQIKKREGIFSQLNPGILMPINKNTSRIQGKWDFNDW